ncbi:MAG: nucleotidyltransferase domain-containing protein [Phycisphaerales bacterium]|nr:nucleotidyltransferase domain-containing protein [Planctomycetota bacterium]
MVTRQEVLQGVIPRLQSHEKVLAAWLGGSDATGRADEKSDIDLCVIAEDGSAAELRSVIETALEAVVPIRLKYDLPAPTWHGFMQSFYQLENAPEWLMVDWVLVERSQRNPWLEVERHGSPRILFDKIGIIKPVHANVEALGIAAAAKVREVAVKFPMFRHLPVKLVERGLPVDAASFYQGLVLRPLVDLLRCLYCPERHDFGFRYLKADLPPEIYSEVEGLSYFATPDDILRHVQTASRLFDAALTTWNERERRGG